MLYVIYSAVQKKRLIYFTYIFACQLSIVNFWLGIKLEFFVVIRDRPDASVVIFIRNRVRIVEHVPPLSVFSRWFLWIFRLLFIKDPVRDRLFVYFTSASIHHHKNTKNENNSINITPSQPTVPCLSTKKKCRRRRRRRNRRLLLTGIVNEIRVPLMTPGVGITMEDGGWV